jgi:hypothetical protein
MRCCVSCAQSEGADPFIRSKDFDPYLKPGLHLPSDLTKDEPEARTPKSARQGCRMR